MAFYRPPRMGYPGPPELNNPPIRQRPPSFGYPGPPELNPTPMPWNPQPAPIGPRQPLMGQPQTQEPIDMKGFLESDPNLAYQAALKRSLLQRWYNKPGPMGTSSLGRYSPSTNFQDYWRSRSGDVYNRYLGDIGFTATKGQVPEQGFTDYLKDFSFWDEFNRQAPWARGQRQSQRGFWNIQP